VHTAKPLPGLIGFQRPPAPPPASKLDVRRPGGFRVGRDDRAAFVVFDPGTPGAVSFVLDASAAAQLALDLARASEELTAAARALAEAAGPTDGEAE
jgi:hypothetical protein